MTERPTIIVDTPFGQMRAVFNGANQIHLKDTSDVLWSAEHNAHLNSGSPIFINGVLYRASYTAQRDAETGDWIETYSSIDRDGSVKMYDFSPAALRKFKVTMPTVCAEVAEKHPDLLRLGEIARLTEEHARAAKEASGLLMEYDLARAEEQRLIEELTAAKAGAGELDGEPA